MWRIKEAINYPAPNIGRDKVIPELFRFRNQPDKLIIVYMQDERHGTQAAQMLTEKGYENTYLLSGGCESFLEDYPEMCEGKQVPTPKRILAEEEERRLQEKKDARKVKHHTNCVISKF